MEFEKPALFAVWLTWTGSDPSLKSVMLNSHIDVVPVDEVSLSTVQISNRYGCSMHDS